MQVIKRHACTEILINVFVIFNRTIQTRIARRINLADLYILGVIVNMNYNTNLQTIAMHN